MVGMAAVSRRDFARLGVCALALAGTALGTGALSGCGRSGGGSTGSGSSKAGAYRIGVVQLVQHAALDQANRGFIKALDKAKLSCTVDQENAQNDQSICQTIAEKLVNDGNDLIFAIGTPAAQAVAGATADIPIVATAVTDFTVARLVDSDEKPGGNVTGTSDMNPVADQMQLLHLLVPAAKHVGMLYCSAESNSTLQIKVAEKACRGLGLRTERFTVSSSNEIQSVVESMAGKIDAIYAPTDNTISAGMGTVSQVAGDARIPVICGEKNQVVAGGLASISVDYAQLGRKAGELAVRILQGKADPARTPVETLTVDECELVVNKETAAALGIDLSVLGSRDYRYV